MTFLIKVLVNAVALWVAAWLVTGIRLAEDAESTQQQIITILLVALIFGVVNAIIRPVLIVLSVPALILTLGLFIFIVNAAMLWLTSWLAESLNLAFSIDNFFWSAILGSLIISIVSMIINAILPAER